MKTFRQLSLFLIRLFVVWQVDTLALLATAFLLGGVTLTPVENHSVVVMATAVAFTLGMANFLVRPFLLLVMLPLGWIAVFLAGFFINGIILQIAAALMPGFTVTGLWVAIGGGFLFSLINTLLSILFDIDDDDSFYENLVQRQAARQAEKGQESAGRGLVILETDGLSYQRIKDAIKKGYMPTLQAMIAEDGYKISRIDCGIPPTTPACQAGILQGNNTNIPAFRWLDKKTGRMLAGPTAAAEIELVLSDGKGLLYDGSSIGNMFSGDAAKSLLTFSKLFAGTQSDKKQRARDMYLLMRNPYFFTRTLVLFFGDVLQELWQGWQQRRQNVRPRLNRLHAGYPFLRAFINIFLRDIGTYFTILDILRGAPAIYTLYAGYDEVAHHSGPLTRDALLTLRQFDRQVARIKTVIECRAKRPYEILILSDHGQSWGPTFLQRYGISISDFIKQQLPKELSVASSGGGDDGTLGIAAMMDELQNIQDQRQGGAVAQAMLSQAQRAIRAKLSQQPAYKKVKPAKVTVAYGGNGALVYFDLFPRRILLRELNSAYPGLVDSLVQHEGIGFVVAYDDDCEPVVFGKGGARNLSTGDVTGEDPLKPFGDIELRAWQLKRVADFENCGDLILNSTLYPDGTVAAMEELIGSHGGIGGEQTDAYLFHPGDMVVPETRNAYEFKAILESRRGLLGVPPRLARQQIIPVNPWSWEVIRAGITQVSQWAGLALRALLLDREAYRAIGSNPHMTAPALLIALAAVLIQTLTQPQGFEVLNFLLRFGSWAIAIGLLFMSARFLRGKADFQSTLRVAGFAQTAYLVNLLAFLPVVGPLARALAIAFGFFAVWMGASEVHALRGWRSLILPLIYLLVSIVSIVFLLSAFSGTRFALQSLLLELGWNPKP